MKMLLLVIGVALFFYAIRRANLKYTRDDTPPETEHVSDYDPETGEILERHTPRPSWLSEWENSLQTLWSGEIPIEFTYKARGKDRERRKVKVREVLEDGAGRIYLRGHCLLRDEERTFNVDSIKTKILCGGERYEVDDFLCDKLGLE